jgi:hypothetical protein
MRLLWRGFAGAKCGIAAMLPRTGTPFRRAQIPPQTPQLARELHIVKNAFVTGTKLITKQVNIYNSPSQSCSSGVTDRSIRCVGWFADRFASFS